MGCLPEDKALGAKWDVEKDTLGFTMKLVEKPSTRCGLHSMLSSVCNPLGLEAPVMLKGRQRFSNCAKISWNGKSKLMKGLHMSGFSRKTLC